MNESLFSQSTENEILGKAIRFCDKAHEILSRLSEKHFYFEHNRELFRIIKKVSESGSPSVIAVQAEVERQGAIEIIGGPARLLDLVDCAVSLAGLESEIEILLDRFARREMESFARWASAQVVEAESADDLIDKSSRRLLEIAHGASAGGARSVLAADLLPGVLAEELPRTIPTGIPWWDSHYTPRPGHFVVIAGFSGGGKTALASGISAAMGCAGPVLIASLEMNKSEIIERMIPWQIGGIPFHAITSRTLTEEQRHGIREGMAGLKVHITDAETITEIEQTARAIRLQYGRIDAVLIDYLQIVSTPGSNRNSTRANEVSTITRQCKRMAQRLECVVFGISQLNNDASRDQGIPQLHHLKESGSIRQDADAVAMVYHPDPKSFAESRKALDNYRAIRSRDPERWRDAKLDPEYLAAKANAERRVLDFQKVRNGPPGAIPLRFDSQHVRFAPG